MKIHEDTWNPRHNKALAHGGKKPQRKNATRLVRHTTENPNFTALGHPLGPKGRVAWARASGLVVLQVSNASLL